jgi:hypothetical protein
MGHGKHPSAGLSVSMADRDEPGDGNDYGVVIKSYSAWTLPLKVIWPL